MTMFHTKSFSKKELSCLVLDKWQETSFRYSHDVTCEKLRIANGGRLQGCNSRLKNVLFFASEDGKLGLHDGLGRAICWSCSG